MSDTEKDRIFQLHAHHTVVLNIQSQLEVHNRQDLARAYSPGVALLSQEIAKNPRFKRQYTLSGKLIVLITDGSAVLGLENLGPAAGLPVIEGKALSYKDLADVNAFSSGSSSGYATARLLHAIGVQHLTLVRYPWRHYT